MKRNIPVRSSAQIEVGWAKRADTEAEAPGWCVSHTLRGRKPRLRIPGGPPEIRVGQHFPGTISRRISTVKERDFTRSPGPPSCTNEVAGITPIVEELGELVHRDGHDACSRVARRFDRSRRDNAA